MEGFFIRPVASSTYVYKHSAPLPQLTGARMCPHHVSFCGI